MKCQLKETSQFLTCLKCLRNRTSLAATKWEMIFHLLRDLSFAYNFVTIFFLQQNNFLVKPFVGKTSLENRRHCCLIQ